VKRLLALGAAGLAMTACARTAAPAVSVEPTRPELVIHLLPGGAAPRATLTFLDRGQKASMGSYCWSGRPDVVACADTTDQYLVVDSHLLVPWGTVIRIEGEMTEVSARLGVVTAQACHANFDPVQKLALKDGSDVLTADAGEYTLDLFARWAGGDAALAFGIGITRTG
jgi:hypothetical protein